GVYNLISAGGYDIFIWKLNLSGNLVWAKAMGSPNQETANAIAVDGAGNVYTTGVFHDTCDFDPGPSTYNLTAPGQEHIFVSKLNASGNFIWAKQMGGTAYGNIGHSIVLDASSNV